MSPEAAPILPAGAPEPLLRVRNLRKSFGGHEVLKGIDLDVAAGEVLCLIGPSGSGKSTILRTIAALDPPDRGVVVLDGRPVGLKVRGGRLIQASPDETRRARSDIGFVFQQFNLFAHLTVLENIVLAPVLVQKRDRREAQAHALALLHQVGLEHKRDAYPAELSGGQQQRVAIARALARRPKVILFDEPTSALDPELVGEVLQVITALASTGITMVIATHEMDFARHVAGHVAFLDGGRIVEYGPPAQVIENPHNERTRAFLRRFLHASGGRGL